MPWKIKPGEAVQGECPLCRRSLGSLTVVLRKVDLEHGICRCGRKFNAMARKRLRVWMCSRKVAYTLEEAEHTAEDMRASAKALIHPYLCPFRDTHTDKPYHVGSERKDV